MKETVLVNAFRSTLYSPEELLGGYDGARAESYAESLDFQVYREYVRGGKVGLASYSDTIVQSLHDNSISYATRALLAGRKVAAIMGGHRTPRDSPAYQQVAWMARELTQANILMCSGGGPGAMEATHLGASLAGEPDEALEAAIATLSEAPELPDASQLVARDGAVNKRVLRELHRWQRPAFAVAATMTARAVSLAIPTWHYGHEPPTPFASHIAKYFSNSIREDGLLAIAGQGVIYTEGRAGTLQEVFQDAAQNYYRSYEWFSPMVFFGVRHWTEEMPVLPLLSRLFKEDYARHVLVTDDGAEAVSFILGFVPPRA